MARWISFLANHVFRQERIEPAKPAREQACNLYKQQISNMVAYAKMSNIHIWHLWGNPQAEGNMKLGFHTSASLTAVS